MSVFRKGKIWYIDYYVAGRRRREAVGASRKMADKVHAKRLSQLAEGRFLDIQTQSKSTFNELARLYMEYAKTNKRSWERDQYSLMHLSTKFGGKRLSEITPILIEEYKSERLKAVKPATLNREMNCLKHMFTKAIQWDKIGVSPAASVKLMRVNNVRVRFLSREECQVLYNACSVQLRPIVLFALHTGMRRGEILSLAWEDVNLDRRLIRVMHTKNGEPRDIPMSEEVSQLLRELEVCGTQVFTRPGGQAIRDLRTGFANALKRAGITNFRFHDLRHTFASHLVMNGVDLLTVKELLGHKSIDMTLRYSHLSASHKHKAVDSLKLFDRHYLDTWSPEQIKKKKLSDCGTTDAEVVKLVDALRSGRSSCKGVGVRVPPSAPL